QMYIKLFGADYEPDPYIQRDYAYAREHKWYMSARLICVNDLYAFDPNVKVELEEFTDVVGRHFRQPKEGLGWDASPSAHMWRTIMMPTKYLRSTSLTPELSPRPPRPSGANGRRRPAVQRFGGSCHDDDHPTMHRLTAPPAP